MIQLLAILLCMILTNQVLTMCMKKDKTGWDIVNIAIASLMILRAWGLVMAWDFGAVAS